ncbi:hypothetical protein FE634_22190 [Nocardioides dongxiaopingii]|uniref:hypothetical protein n=1 Tax=Nocardioides TaxID=1839 RepID=UPI0010C77083|nr:MULTISPECIES: hypothetical protein [Nocardioides]QDH11199.1 hypothetical protein FE634_22190 [Nocardioides sp. S-1144]
MAHHETHERTRIIREVEAVAVVDMTGRLPWKASWAMHFGDREGLLEALRERWERMCVVQGGPDGHQRLRRTHAGMLRILDAHAPGATEPRRLAG